MSAKDDRRVKSRGTSAFRVGKTGCFAPKTAAHNVSGKKIEPVPSVIMVPVLPPGSHPLVIAIVYRPKSKTQEADSKALGQVYPDQGALRLSAVPELQKESKMKAVDIKEYKAIADTFQHYLDGARSGKGDEMRPAFHEQATIFGYVGPDLFAGPIEELFAWIDDNGAATDVVAHVNIIEVVETVAIVRVDADNWTGHRFTDFFTLLKVDGSWKIMNKVFHLHDE